MSSLIEYCKENNLKGVEDCLSQGEDVNTVDNKKTGLMIACEAGHPAIVSRLVEVPGVDIMFPNMFGETAAHYASFLGHYDCLKILADTGRVDWNRRDCLGRTPLFFALIMGHPDCVEIIVQQPDIDYSVKTEGGNTLAHAAVRRGSTECVRILAAQERCDCWNVPDCLWGDTPIMRALKRGKTEIVEILVRCPRVDLNCRDSVGWSLVFRAIQKNKLGKKRLKFWFRKSLNLCL